MAYMSQERKKQIKVELDKVLKGTGIKYSLGVRHHSTLVLNISQGPVDFIGNHNAVVSDANYIHFHPNANLAKNYLDINTHWYHEHFTGNVLELLKKIVTVMMTGNHDNSDSMSDYFDVGWYIDINVGKWDRPYRLIGA
jgi:hypothetical protein